MHPVFEDGLRKAHRASVKDGRLRFVTATAYGVKIWLRRNAAQMEWWTNGQDAGFWKAHEPSGVTDTSLSACLREQEGER